MALFGLCLAPRARAADVIAIRYRDPALAELVQRLANELTSDGYVVQLPATHEASPCERPANDGASERTPNAAWISVVADPADPQTVLASICFRGSVTLLQRTSSRGLRSEPERFALTTAEALNGLSAQVPVLVQRATRPNPRAAAPRAEAAVLDAGGHGMNSLSLGQSALIDPSGVPVRWGVALEATLPATANLSLSFDAVLPVSAAELNSSEVRARLRTAWVRGGTTLSWRVARANVTGSLLAGPALSWATAEAEPPRVGTADVALSALVSLGLGLEYPQDSGVFARASARATALLPAGQVALADDTRRLSPVVIEATLGIGVRWSGL